MTRMAAPIRICILLAVCVLLFAGYRHALWSLSFDLAHHYALVMRPSELLGTASTLAATPSAQLPPNFSHGIAAALSAFTGSHFLSMHVTALLSLIAIWLCLALTTASLPRRAAMTASAGIVVLMLLNRKVLQLPLFGHEIAGAYLYAQIVAQALAMGLLCVAVFHERRAAPAGTRHLLLLAGVVTVAYASLLPALALLLTLLVLLLIDSLQTQRMRAWLGNGALAVVAIAGLALHPALRADLATAVRATAIDGARIDALLCLLVLPASLALIRAWRRLTSEASRRDYAALKYIGAAGVGIALLAIASLLALKTGRCALLTTLQYRFALDTLALLTLALLPVLPQMKSGAAAPNRSRFASFSAFALAPALLAATVVGVAPRASQADVATVVSLEQQIRQLRMTTLPDIADSRDYAAELPGVPPAIAAMLTLGILKTPADAITGQWLEGRRPDSLCGAGSVITSLSSSLAAPACMRQAGGVPLALLDARCVGKTVLHAPLCGSRFDFKLKGGLDDKLLIGFGGAEEHGRWTNAASASFSSDKAALEQAEFVVIDAFAYVPAEKVQHLQLRINGAVAGDYVFDSKHDSRVIRLPVHLNGKTGIRIDFLVPDAVSPHALGLGADARTLAVSVRTITFE